MKIKEFYLLLALFFYKDLISYWFDKEVQKHLIEELLPDLIELIKRHDSKFDEARFMDIVRFGL